VIYNNKNILRKYIQKILNEDASDKVGEVLEERYENLRKVLLYLGFQKSQLDFIELKIDQVHNSGLAILHHQFRNINGSPEMQFKKNVILNNPGSQAHLHSDAARLRIISMCYSILALNVSTDLKLKVMKEIYNVSDEKTEKEILNMYSSSVLFNIHKDPLGIKLFVVPNVAQYKWEGWIMDNCLFKSDWNPLQELAYLVIKSIKINDRSRKITQNFLYTSSSANKSSKKAISDKAKKHIEEIKLQKKDI
tara:strand:+ start:1880 stop:2629 length:750 start_codon:yes stop_codon:yes gene_type:complete